LWPGHNNVLQLRAHTAGTLPVDFATLDVSITQPALFSSECGSPTRVDVQQVETGPIDPVEGGYASLDFRTRPGSVGIQMVSPGDPASGREESNAVASRFAYLFFPAGSTTPGVTRFALSANDDCDRKALFRVTPAAVPDGWTVSVRPEIAALPPGRKRYVTVIVQPPPGAGPGTKGDIGIAVAETGDTPRAMPADDPAIPVDSGLLKHTELLGWMEVFAKVVGEPARVELACGPAGRPPRPGEPILVSGNLIPAVANTQVMLEYASSSGRETRFAATDATGRFTDSFVPDNMGRTRVQAFWPGDATHAPAQSRWCLR
jgi:hypothetical protein